MIGQLLNFAGGFKIVHGALACNLSELVTKARAQYMAQLYSQYKGTCVTSGLLPAYGFTGKPFAGLGFVGLRGDKDATTVQTHVDDILPGIVTYAGTHTFTLEPDENKPITPVDENLLGIFGSLQHWLRTGELNTQTLITCECVDAFLDSYYLGYLAELLLLACRDLQSTVLVATHNDATVTRFIEAQKKVNVPGTLLCLPGKFDAERLLTESGVLYEDVLE